MAREMKDSGVPWIGEIPREWKMSRVGLHYDIILGKMLCTTQPNDDYTLEPYYCAANIHFDGISNEAIKEMWFSVAEKELYRVKQNDLLVVEGGAGAGGCAIVPNLQHDVYIQNSVMIVRPKAEQCSRFLRYLIEHLVKSGYIDVVCNKATIPHFTKDKLANVPIPLSTEQRRIADFLDAECARIDTVIEQTRASIEEYKKLKQSVITQAVTKGIRPGRKMKDSGIEWIGDIPEEWDSINPKALFSQRKDKALPGERQLTASQQYGVIYQDEYMERTGSKVVTVEKDFDILKHVETGDFVISMRSFQGGLEYSTNTGSISSAYVMLVPNLDKVFPQYYRWLLKSTVYIDALQSTSNMVRDGQAMRYSNFAQVRLITVPMDEQKEIANYLDEKCFAMEKLIELKERFLAELESYKKSLIYEYVTGKKVVC